MLILRERPAVICLCGLAVVPGMVVMSQIAGPPRQPVPSPSMPITAHRAWFTRPALIIPLALVVTAAVAAALFLALRPGTITASGTVIDGRTGQPVAMASLHAGGKSARTNARGVFRIPGLAPNAKVSVRARYYAAAKVRAVGTPQRVRLAPIPVYVTVTSDLTGNPLPAVVSPPNGSLVTASADGTATVYLTGPGETLTVTTGGYRPAHAVIARDNTATAGLEPTRRTMRTQPWARLWAWANRGNYRAIAGWVLRGYSLLPGTRLNRGGGADPQIAHITTGYIDSLSVSVNVFTAKRGAYWDPPSTPAIDTGVSPRPVRLAGHRAWHGGPDSSGQFDTMWSYDPVFIITTGPSQASADAVMTSIIKAITGHQR
jgi:carboxypeptidase family protein